MTDLKIRGSKNLKNELACENAGTGAGDRSSGSCCLESFIEIWASSVPKAKCPMFIDFRQQGLLTFARRKRPRETSPAAKSEGETDALAGYLTSNNLLRVARSRLKMGVTFGTKCNDICYEPSITKCRIMPFAGLRY